MVHANAVLSSPSPTRCMDRGEGGMGGFVRTAGAAQMLMLFGIIDGSWNG